MKRACQTEQMEDVEQESSSYEVVESTSEGSYFDRLVAAWQSFVESLAPMGYEDETGFHYGNRRKTRH